MKKLNRFLKKIKSNRKKTGEKPIFEGIFKDFSQVQQIIPDSSPELNRRLRRATKRLKQIHKAESLPIARFPSIYANLFSLLVSVSIEAKGKVSILDFGGSVGLTYLDLAETTDTKDLDYFIVELKEAKEKGAQLFSQIKNVHFYDHIPDIDHIDIVHLGSVLQYIPDYKQLLLRLMALTPKYIFLTHSLMGNAPSFVTAQINIENVRKAYWIFNLQEIIQFMHNNNYKLIHHSANYPPKRRYRFENFPEDYRIQNTSNLLFALKTNS